MSDKPKILVRRIQPGLGDVIGSTVAMRAVLERYGDDHEVHATFGLRKWCELFADQGIAHRVVSHEIARGSPEQLAGYDHIFELDGPEFRHANHINWGPMNRIEIWCASVDHTPKDLCPRWRPTKGERSRADQTIRRAFSGVGQADRPLIIVQARPHMGMPWKHWMHTPEFVRTMAQDYRVMVVHDTPLPEYSSQDGFVFNHDLDLRQLGSILRCADLVVGPDSALIHFAAAVGVPCLGLYGGTDGRETTRLYPKARFIQGQIDELWLCHGKDKAPCHGMATRAFWCGSRDFLSMGKCMEGIDPSSVVEECRKILDGRLGVKQ